MADLKGQVALITGAARYRGIGRATALALAAAGADIVVCGRAQNPENFSDEEMALDWKGLHSVVEEVGDLGRKALAITCDVTQPDQVKTMRDTISNELSRLDIIVNNAAYSGSAGATPIFETSEEEWKQTLSVNVDGVFHVTKYCGQLMLDYGKGGNIVMVSSLLGRMGAADRGAYCTSKFAVIGMTQQLAMELAKKSVRVNCVCPGPHETDMLGSIANHTEQKHGLNQGSYMEQINSAVPMGRAGKAQETAATIVFLCGEGASYITGQTINVNGGLRMD